jgi:hypothetical protein
MALEEEMRILATALEEFPKKIEVQIVDSIDGNRIARSLESIADSLSIIAREFR